MHKKTFLLTSLAVLFCLSGTVSARDYWWSDLDDVNQLWSSPDNWCSKDDPCNPNPDMNLPTLKDIVYIGKGELHVPYPVFLFDLVMYGGATISPPEIADGVVAEANSIWLGSGDSLASTPDPCKDAYMSITGGSLTIGRTQPWTNWWGEGGLYIGLVSSGTGTLTVSGGDVYVGSHIEIGAWQGTGTLVMEGGTIEVEHGIWCPSTGYAATGHVDLHGGTIYADSFTIVDWLNPIGGTMDITEGTMILRGNEADQILSYVEGVWNDNKNCWAQKIFTYGLEHGDVNEGLRVIVEVDYDYRNDDETTVTATKINPNLAWDPAPYMGQTGVEGSLAALTRPTLAWKAGETAVGHHLYFGSDFNDVSDADKDESLEFYVGEFNDANSGWTCDEDLEYHSFHYWRVDEEDVSEQIIKGDTWMFRMANLGAASDPVPETYPPAENVSPMVTLSWTPGLDNLRHKLYLSTDYNDVYDCNENASLTIQDTNTYNYYVKQGQPLERDTTYYWRVDEVNDTGLVWAGDIWSFTTADYVPVDEFEYGKTDKLRMTWEDVWVNDTGAQVFAELGVVFDGSRSMRYKYSNWLDPYYAEASAPTSLLEIGSDWTILGVRALSVWFMGNPNNDPERMYLGLEDPDSYAEVEYDGDPCDILVGAWYEWAIDLEDFNDGGVEMSDVQTVYIGFGDRSDPVDHGDIEGDVWFDALRLHPVRCFSMRGPVGDIDGDCITDYNDLEIMGQDWLLTDSNTLGYTGTLDDFNENNLMWHPYDGNSVDGGSLEFALGHEDDPVEGWTTSPDRVIIPPLSLYSNELTITAWVKRKGIQYPFSGIVFCRYDHDGDGVFKSAGDTCAGISFGRDHELRYHWDDDYWNINQGLYIEDQIWTFVALTVTPDEAYMYVRSLGGDLRPGSNYKPHVIEEFLGPTYIGEDSHNQPRNIRALVDDVRIYNEIAMSDSQIRYLSSFGDDPAGEDPVVTPTAWYKLDESSGFVAEDSSIPELHYWPVASIANPYIPSKANLYDDEPRYQRNVNMRDYALLADTWLQEKLFP